jgi:hypothetical protein
MENPWLKSLCHKCGYFKNDFGECECDSKEFAKIQVGEPFTLFRNKLGDGSYFESLDDNGGFIMATYLYHMSPEERDLLWGGEIHTKMIREGNKIIFLLKFGDSDLINEVYFDPTLYNDKRAMQIAFDNHMVQFVSIERSNNIIKTLRMANFPMNLKQACITSWSKAYDEQNYSENYGNWIGQLMANYSTLELWAKGEYAGQFGEKGLLE